MPDLGRAALTTALALLVYALVGGGYAAWRRRRRLADSARNALIGAFGASADPTVVLFAAVARQQLSFPYVLGPFWGGEEGSLPLWLLALSGSSGAAVLLNRHAGRDVVAWVVPVLGLV